MLKSIEDFLAKEDNCLGICGVHINDDAFHVGIFWRWKDEKSNEAKIFHFQNGNYIPLEEASDPKFKPYYINYIPEFEIKDIPTLSAYASLISENRLNNFVFNKEAVVYNGGKFKRDGTYLTKNASERFVNCAVFTFVFLISFGDYILLNWETWPNVEMDKLKFLDDWLDKNGIPAEERDAYYACTKALRGKHVIVCPTTKTKPSPYDEANKLADDLIAALTA